MLHLEFDGDLPSPGALLLMALNSDGQRAESLPANMRACANHWAVRRASHPPPWQPNPHPHPNPDPHPDPTPNQAKLVWQPFYQLMHFWSLFPIHLVLGVLINPVTYPLAAAYLAAPPATQRRGALLGAHPC